MVWAELAVAAVDATIVLRAGYIVQIAELLEIVTKEEAASLNNWLHKWPATPEALKKMPGIDNVLLTLAGALELDGDEGESDG